MERRERVGQYRRGTVVSVSLPIGETPVDPTGHSG